jgi:hypothetical protein
VPQVDSVLTNYLSQFSLWAQRVTSGKLSINTAAPGILLQANDAPVGTVPAVFMLQVTTAGAVVLTPVSVGSGQP